MALLAGALLAVTLAGCTSGSGSPGAAGGADPSASPGEAAATLAPSGDEASPTASATPSVTPPGTTSGDLTASALPTAQDLGRGWRTRVEGGDAEDGIGNGTPFQERDPAEITQTVLPMGCATRSPSPEPANVLQATFTHPRTGAYAVALRMRFGSATDAATFARVLRPDLESCARQPDDPYSGAPAPVLGVDVAPTGAYVARYRLVGEESVWVRALRVEGRDVVTLDTDSAPGRVDWAALGFPEP